MVIWDNTLNGVQINVDNRTLLAEGALGNLDISTAEHAFVKLKDYAALQFIKKVNNIQV
jgi:hypothetical protein